MSAPLCKPGTHRLRFVDGERRACERCPYTDGTITPRGGEEEWRGSYSPRDGRRIQDPGEFDSIELGGRR